MRKRMIGATLAGLCLAAVAFASSPSETATPVNPYAAIYSRNVAGMKVPDQSLDQVPPPNAALTAEVFFASAGGAQASRTCSQRCSTTCSTTCTTTRGCSSNCKVQTDGCGGARPAPVPAPRTGTGTTPLPSSAAAAAATSGGDQFSLGSTEADVKRIMGTPTSIIGGGWSYGYSSVSFRNGVVVGYSNITGNLKVVLKPSDPLLKESTFEMGSTRDQVLSAQGTPSSVIGDSWSYGYSSVTFRDDKVSSYSNISNNLRVR